MAVPAQSTVVPYNCNGVTDIFDVTFTYQEVSEIQVKYFNSDEKTYHDLILNTDFVVIEDATTQIQTLLTYPSGDRITVYLGKVPRQTVELEKQSTLPADVAEEIADNSVLLIQQLFGLYERAILRPLDETGQMTLPSVEERGGELAGWDAQGNFTPVTGVLEGTAVSTFMKPVLLSVNSAAARASIEAAAEIAETQAAEATTKNEEQDLRLVALETDVAELQADAINGHPLATITALLSTEVPNGWLLCNGATLLIEDYPELFAIIGTVFGGDGSITFDLPDLRGIGLSMMGTQTGPSGQTWGDSGADLGDKIEDQMQGHYHQNYDVSAVGSVDGSTPYADKGNAAGTAGYQTLEAVTDGVNGTPRTGEYTRGPALAVNFIIKARVTLAIEYNDPHFDSRVLAVEVQNEQQDAQIEALTRIVGQAPAPVKEIISFGSLNCGGVWTEADELVTWAGNTGSRESGHGQDAQQRAAPLNIPEKQNVAIRDAFIAGRECWALFEDDTLYQWGWNFRGHFGLGDTTVRHVPTLSLSSVKRVFTRDSGYHVQDRGMLVEKTDGTIWFAGYNNNGQAGLGTYGFESTWVQVTQLGTNQVVNIWTSGGSFGNSFALKTDGTLWATGYNAHGQLGDGSFTERWSWVNVSTNWGVTAVSDVVDIICTGPCYDSPTGYYDGASFLLHSDGTVRCSGGNFHANLGNGNTTNQNTPYTHDLAEDLTGLMTVGDGRWSTIYVRSDSGKVWRWGYNDNGAVGDGTTTDRTTPYNSGSSTNIDNNSDEFLMRRQTGHDEPWSSGVFLKHKTTGQLYACGRNGRGNLCLGNTTSPTTTFTACYAPTDIVQISRNGYQNTGEFYLMLDSKGRLWGSGYAGRYDLAMAGAESTVDLWTAQELNLGGTGAVAPPSPEVFNSVEKFLDSSYSYFSGYTDEGWKVNRWDVDAVKSVSTGTGEKPDTLAECQALSYS